MTDRCYLGNDTLFVLPIGPDVFFAVEGARLRGGAIQALCSAEAERIEEGGGEMIDILHLPR